MKRVFISLVAGLGIVFFSFQSFGGTLTAELDRTEGSVDEPLILTITIEGDAATAIDLPNIENLNFYQRGTSQQHTLMNGKFSKKQIFNILVQALKPGAYTIPSLKIEIDGKLESSLPLTFKISNTGSKTPPDTSNSQPSNSTTEDEVMDQTPRGTAEQQQIQAFKNIEKTGGVFVDRQCNPPSVYLGEQIICNVRIYHPGNFNSGQKIPENSPDFRRFMPEGEKRYNQVINGRRFGVIEVTEIFVPLKEGDRVIPAFILDAQVVSWEQRKNPLDKFFDRFGGGVFDFDFSYPDTKVVRLTHPENKIQVKPLPKEGQPPQFKGIVGSFNLLGGIQKNQVAAGDTVTVTLTMEGKGVLDTAVEPQLNIDPSIKKYTDKPEYREKIDRTSGVESQKTFKIALVPSKPGTFVLGQVSIPIFDPQTGQYRNLTQDLGTLIVTPGQGEEKLIALGTTLEPAKQAIKEQGKDLFGPHDVALLEANHSLSPFSIKVMGASGSIGFASPVLALVWKWRRRRKEADTAGIRRSAAHKKFKAKTKVALQLIQSDQIEGGLSALYRGFKEFLGDLANTQGAAMTLRDVTEFLKQRAIPEDSFKKVLGLLEHIERVEFSGQKPDKAGAMRWLQDLEAFADEVDR